MTLTWDGVLPAITTPFTPAGDVDHELLARHARWLVEAGCDAIVALGSLGEGATLSVPEKLAILGTLVQALHGSAPVVAGIAALSTDEACALAREAAGLGCEALMVLPPYVYSTDWREMRAHVSAVIAATPMPCILYNNPIAYRTDFRPGQVAELARDHDNLVAVKESSGDVRRITALRQLLGQRLHLLVGVDDLLVEGVEAGATGWVAGLVNALPRESVALHRLALQARSVPGAREARDALYRWFLPLLEMDTVPKFVQLIKLAQAEAGWGHERVRAPRLVLEGAERAAALETIRAALQIRPAGLEARATARA